MLSKSPATEIRIAKLEARIAELEASFEDVFVMWLSGTPHTRAPNIKEAARKALVKEDIDDT